MGHQKEQCVIAQEGRTDFDSAEEGLLGKVPGMILGWVKVVMWVWVKG